jgi:hypothetical protein
MIPEFPSPEAVPDRYTGTQSASRLVSPADKDACTGSGPCVSIQNITFLHIEGQRETAYGPEYRVFGQDMA